MTGFGTGTAAGAGLSVRAEARSVNHRHLQVKVRLPPELAAVELDVDTLVKKRVGRGAVSVSVSVESAERHAAAIDHEVARRYKKELAKIAHELELSAEIPLATLLTLPGVVGVDGAGARAASHSKVVLAAVDAALAELVRMRDREGAALEKDLRRHAEKLRKVLDHVEKRVPSVVRAARDALKRRVKALLDGRAVSEAELAREIALLADRYDVSEELARLASHIAQLEEQLASEASESVGRRLDFLVQEIFRELNTVGAKCGDARIAQWVIDGKTLLERLREQVQNVE
jgi:uncharacterized protein (TIGR00255 family)